MATHESWREPPDRQMWRIELREKLTENSRDNRKQEGTEGSKGENGPL